MIRGRAGLAETDNEAATRTRVAALLDEHVPDRRRAPLDRARAPGAPGHRDRHRERPAVRCLADVLRAPRRDGTRGPRVRGPPLGRFGHARLHRPPARVEPRDPALHRDARPPGAARAASGLGRRPAQLHEPVPRAAAARPRCARCSPGLVPGLPETAVRAIVDRAEGIPLYAVETVRMLVAEGRLADAGDGTYAPTGDLSTLAIPETLTALIAARLDSLEPADRSLVLDAAVLGQSFTPAGLAAVSGIDRDDARATPPVARPPRAVRPRDRSPLARARPVRVRPGADPGGRVQHAREARTARRATSRRPATSRRSRRTSSRARSPATTSPPATTRRRARRPMPSAPRRGSRFAAPPNGRSRSARTTRPSRSTSRPSTSPTSRRTGPSSSSAPASRRPSPGATTPPSATCGRPSSCAARSAIARRSPAPSPRSDSR